jgi:hypothetical protein
MKASTEGARTRTARARSNRWYRAFAAAGVALSSVTVAACATDVGSDAGDSRVGRSGTAIIAILPGPICPIVGCAPPPPTWVTNTCKPAIQLEETALAASYPGDFSALGTQVGNIEYYTTNAGVPVCFQAFTNGSVEWSAASGAREIDGQVYWDWLNHGAEENPLGMPIWEEGHGGLCLSSRCSGTGSEVSPLQNGFLTWTPANGIQTVLPPIATIWAADRSCMGFPVGAWSSANDVQTFERGTIHYTPGSAAWTGGCRGGDREPCYTDGSCDAPDVCHYDGLCGAPTICGELYQGPCNLSCDDELHLNTDPSAAHYWQCIPNSPQCGYGDQPCCGNVLPGQCNNGFVCSNVLGGEGIPGYSFFGPSSCIVPPPGWTPCGATGEPCCPHAAGLTGCSGTCSAGLCQACGGAGQPCCTSGVACQGIPSWPNTGPGGICRAGTCAPCGLLGDVCCPGNACNEYNVLCVSGVCTESGGGAALTCMGARATTAQDFAVPVKQSNGCGTYTTFFANSLAEAQGCAGSSAVSALRQPPVAIYWGCDGGYCNCSGGSVPVPSESDDSEIVACANSVDGPCEPGNYACDHIEAGNCPLGE